jgi:hypothetical protein
MHIEQAARSDSKWLACYGLENEFQHTIDEIRSVVITRFPTLYQKSGAAVS